MDNIWEEIVRLHREACPGMLITVIDKKGKGPSVVGGKMLVDGQGNHIGTVGGGELETLVLDNARELMARQEHGLEVYNLSGDDDGSGGHNLNMVCGGVITLFFEYLPARPVVYIMGVGHVGQSLSRLMKTLGWQVVEVDYRQPLSGADSSLHTVRLKEVIEAARANRESYVVVAGFSHQDDYEMLEAICQAGWQPRYIGLLASPKKCRAILNQLTQQLDKQVDLAMLHSPIGLDLGGKSPEEIALSIAAELQAIRYGKTGNKHLSRPYGLNLPV